MGYNQHGFSSKDKERVYIAFQGKCADCGKYEEGGWHTREPVWGKTRRVFYTGLNQDIHHTVPLSKGGKHERENFTLLCRQCHNKRHMRREGK